MPAPTPAQRRKAMDLAKKRAQDRASLRRSSQFQESGALRVETAVRPFNSSDFDPLTDCPIQALKKSAEADEEMQQILEEMEREDSCIEAPEVS